MKFFTRYFDRASWLFQMYNRSENVLERMMLAKDEPLEKTNVLKYYKTRSSSSAINKSRRNRFFKSSKKTLNKPKVDENQRPIDNLLDLYFNTYKTLAGIKESNGFTNELQKVPAKAMEGNEEIPDANPPTNYNSSNNYHGNQSDSKASENILPMKNERNSSSNEVNNIDGNIIQTINDTKDVEQLNMNKYKLNMDVDEEFVHDEYSNNSNDIEEGNINCERIINKQLINDNTLNISQTGILYPLESKKEFNDVPIVITSKAINTSTVETNIGKIKNLTEEDLKIFHEKFNQNQLNDAVLPKIFYQHKDQIIHNDVICEDGIINDNFKMITMMKNKNEALVGKHKTYTQSSDVDTTKTELNIKENEREKSMDTYKATDEYKYSKKLCDSENSVKENIEIPFKFDNINKNSLDNGKLNKILSVLNLFTDVAKDKTTNQQKKILGKELDVYKESACKTYFRKVCSNVDKNSNTEINEYKLDVIKKMFTNEENDDIKQTSIESKIVKDNFTEIKNSKQLHLQKPVLQDGDIKEDTDVITKLNNYKYLTKATGVNLYNVVQDSKCKPVSYNVNNIEDNKKPILYEKYTERNLKINSYDVDLHKDCIASNRKTGIVENKTENIKTSKEYKTTNSMKLEGIERSWTRIVSSNDIIDAKDDDLNLLVKFVHHERISNGQEFYKDTSTISKQNHVTPNIHKSKSISDVIHEKLYMKDEICEDKQIDNLNDTKCINYKHDLCDRVNINNSYSKYLNENDCLCNKSPHDNKNETITNLEDDDMGTTNTGKMIMNEAINDVKPFRYDNMNVFKSNKTEDQNTEHFHSQLLKCVREAAIICDNKKIEFINVDDTNERLQFTVIGKDQELNLGTQNGDISKNEVIQEFDINNREVLAQIPNLLNLLLTFLEKECPTIIDNKKCGKAEPSNRFKN